MKKISLIAPGELKVHNSEEPILLQDGMVKVKVNACAICGSDLAMVAGKRFDQYFGHEFSGVVTEVSDTSTGVNVGDRVASELAKTCGQCWHCLNGLENYCKSMSEATAPGGFTEYTLARCQKDYRFLSRIPESLDDITASLMEPTNCAYRIASRTEVKPGENVVVFGIGAMGVIAAMILKRLGAGCVIGVGRRPARLEQVRKTGIFDAVVANDEQGMSQIRELVGAPGADVVIEATGTPRVLVDAMQIARYGGRIVVGSVYHGAVEQFEPLPILRKELSIVGAKGPYPYPKSNGDSVVVDVMTMIRDDLKKIIRVYPYQDALKAFEDAKSGDAIKAVITF